MFHTVRGDAGRAREHPEILIDESDLDALWQQVHEVTRRFAPNLDVQLRPKDESPCACPGGRRVLHIAPNGDVSPCAWLYRLSAEKYQVGNISETPIDALVRSAPSPIDSLEGAATGCPLPILEPAHVCNA